MSNQEMIKVWDIPVRLFHWSLVIFFFVAYITGEELETVHAWSGYAVIALIAFRIVWGFVGNKYARFSGFVLGPQKVIEYFSSLVKLSPKHYLGHNPVASWMVVILLASLVLTTWSGLKAYAVEGHGPLANNRISMISEALANGDDDRYEKDHEHEDEKEHDHDYEGRHEYEREDEDEDEFWEELHETFSNFTLFLVVVHIAGVLISSVLHKENLIRAMITGEKRKI